MSIASRPDHAEEFNGHQLLSMLGMSTPFGIGRVPRGINDGKGFVFISYLGEVFPSGFLPASAGNVSKLSLTDRYRPFTAIRSSA